MTEAHAPIDFMSGQFIVLDGFERVPRRRISKVIRGCGAPMGSLGSQKVSPARFLIGDRFERGPAEGRHAVMVDGILLGHVRTSEECVDLKGARVFGEDAIIASTGIGLPANERMSMLRGALQGTPSQAGWNHAVAVLEAWPDALGVEDAIRYVADLTADWPRGLCMASRRWVKRSVKAPAKRMVTAGAVVVRDGDDAAKVRRALDGAPRLESITFKLVANWSYPTRTVEAVLSHPRGQLVRELVFDAPSRGLTALGAHAMLMKLPLPRLERLLLRCQDGRKPYTRAQTLEFAARTPAVQLMDLDGEPLWAS